MSRYTVEGFHFDDAVMAAKAEKEAAKVQYIRSRMTMNQPQSVYSIYIKLIDNHVFSTPVGYSFLEELYLSLLGSGTYREEDLPKLLMRSEQDVTKSREANQTQHTKPEEMQKAEPADAQAISANETQIIKANETQIIEANETQLIKANETQIIEAVRKRTENITSTSKTQVRNIREMYRDKLRTYKLVIAVLAAVIVGLLAMVYFSDTSPFLDAEAKVLDQYAAWQEELTQKEQQLNAREQLLEERERLLTEP